jgi:hypothetical protein
MGCSEKPFARLLGLLLKRQRLDANDGYLAREGTGMRGVFVPAEHLSRHDYGLRIKTSSITSSDVSTHLRPG